MVRLEKEFASIIAAVNYMHRGDVGGAQTRRYDNLKQSDVMELRVF
jgi:hypothetical protein